MNELVDLGMLHPRLAHLDRPASGVSPGLCRAISARFGIDPLLIRILFILGSALSGVSVIAYGWGVLLTPRTGRQAPIHRLLPVFSSWSLRTQWTAIILSSALVVAMVAQVVQMIPVLLLLMFALVLYRRRRGPRRDPAPPVPPLDSRDRPEDDSQLPVVDLYAPEEPAAPVPPECTKISWVGTGLVLFITYLVTAILTTTRAVTNPLLMLAIALGTGGVMILGWGLLVRSRRLPVALLLLALLASIITAGLATGKTEDSVEVSPDQQYTYHFVVTDGAVADLRQLPADSSAIIHVITFMSEVRVILPQAPASSHVTTWGTTMSWPEGTDYQERDSGTRGIQLVIDGGLSDVKVEYPS